MCIYVMIVISTSIKNDIDFRYCIDSNNLHGLGWKPEIDFETGLQQTIDWYKTTNIETYFESTPRL